MILQCENVTKQFGKLTAVNNLSFEVKRGEIFGVAGPNGAGKTTLFNLITGMFAYKGKIAFDGENISGLAEYKICQRGIARTFQIPQLFSSLPVYDNIRVGAHFGGNKVDDEHNAITEAVEFTGLKGKEHVLAGNLNLIDKKRTMIASALATKPKLLMLDEPIAGLNPAEIRSSVDMIKKINTELGLAVIIIEHFMKVLAEVSKRLMILENGEKIFIGTPLEVTNDSRVIKCYLGKGYA